MRRPEPISTDLATDRGFIARLIISAGRFCL